MTELDIMELVAQVSTDVCAYLDKMGMEIPPEPLGKLIANLINHCAQLGKNSADENTIRTYLPN